MKIINLLIYMAVLIFIDIKIVYAGCCQHTAHPIACISEKSVCDSGPRAGPWYKNGKCCTTSICCPDGKVCRNEKCVEKNPSLVELSNFAAETSSKGILLSWNTKTELDSQGFRIWRAIPNLGRYCGCSRNVDDYTQIKVLDKEGKPVLISAEGGITFGFDYSYLDKEAKPGIVYCYALEDIDYEGESEFYFEYVIFTQDSLGKTK